MRIVARLLSALAALLASFAIALLGTVVSLALIGETAVIDRFYLYCWIAGGLGFVLALVVASIRREIRLTLLIISFGIIAFLVPLLRFDNERTALNRIIRYVIFFAHIPASAIFGALLAVAAYRWIVEVSGE